MSADVEKPGPDPDVGEATPTSATSESEAPTLPDDYLTNALWALLAHSNANGGRMDPALFWGFVGRLAQGRGLDARGHAEGLEAIEAECINPNRKGDEARRVYNLAVLRWLLLALAQSGAGAAIAPGLNIGVIVSDVIRLIEGKGTPQLLLRKPAPSERPDEKYIRAMFRGAYVQRVYYEAARDGTNRHDLRARDGVGDEKWKVWDREVSKEAKDAAAAAGLRGDACPPPAVAGLTRHEIYYLATGRVRN